jgi:transposase
MRLEERQAVLTTTPEPDHIVLRLDQTSWRACHVAAFGFFGGSGAGRCATTSWPGWTTPTSTEPKINRSYAELATHYAALIDPARAVNPRTRCVWSGR